ncbi:MAG: 3-dehydroquinate synthase [Oscillospiraceae bacterium]|nr:3-dehydroquinate synthase [Oscillospiraceae bacterium]
MTRIDVHASRHYQILIGAGLLNQIGAEVKTLCPEAKTVAIVTDRHVEAYYLEQVKAALTGLGFAVISYAIPPGEGSKSGVQYLAIMEWLAEQEITSSDVLLALGGGVVGDLTGFVASTCAGGVPYIQIPTSLVAMTDSSVGGKTAIDLEAGKNMVGSFYQPHLVLCDIDTLNTLPEHVFNEGMAEVIKHGMIRSASLLDQLLHESPKEHLEEIVAASVTIKRDIVQTDEFDWGDRQLLNFGHTVGHAIELLSKYQIPHGHAVAIGMMIETRAAVRKGLCAPECLSTLEHLLVRYALPTETDYKADALFDAALHDKKRLGDEIAITAPRELGTCELQTISIEELREWIALGLRP